jgi:hypothetical protein
MTSKLFLLALVSLFCLQAFGAVQGPLYNLVDNRYLGLLDRLKQVQYADQKASLIKTATDTYGFNCSQAWGLLESFKSDGDKLIGLEIIKNNIVDPTNKTKQIIEMFNRNDDRQKATNILLNITACKTVANPNDVTAVWNLPFTNKWSNENLTDLIKVVDQIPSSVGKIKVAEVAIMSRTEVLIPEQLMTLFSAYSSYRDILTLKSLIDERIVGISCEQMVTLLRRFSFENQRSSILDSMQCANSNIVGPYDKDLLALAEFIQGNLMGASCEELSPVAAKFSFEDQMLALLEGFSTSIIDLENKLTILDAFSFGANKEKAKKIIDTFKPNSYLFGSPSGKVVFILDVSGSMDATFKVSPTQTLSRLSFMKREFTRVVSSFNESTAFTVLAFATNVVQWTTGLVNATQTNIKNAIEFGNKYPANGGTNSHEALRMAFNYPGVETIYFLSDGQPSSGTKTDPNAIIADVRSWNPRGKVKINSIALLMGARSDDNKPLSRSFMKALSDVTGGTFRALESEI